MSYNLSHLKELEAESIFVIREVAAQFQNPVLMFSGGKDSILMTHLAYKAFYPAKIPFPLLHIDTGHNFDETIEFRDQLIDKLGVKLLVGSVQEAIDKGMVTEEKGYNASRNSLQTTVLLEALEAGQYDAATVRLSKDKSAFEMAIHAVLSVLKPDAPLYIYGANDEGIKSVPRRLRDLCGELTVIEARRHARLAGGAGRGPQRRVGGGSHPARAGQ